MLPAGEAQVARETNRFREEKRDTWLKSPVAMLMRKRFCCPLAASLLHSGALSGSAGPVYTVCTVLSGQPGPLISLVDSDSLWLCYV